MSLVSRSATCEASCEDIWLRCFRNVAKWPEWDHDITSVEQISGDGTLQENVTCVFIMRGGDKCPMKIHDVIENKAYTHTGTFCCGIVGYTGTFTLQPIGIQRTKITYTFKVTGFLGKVVQKLNEKEFIKGTEAALRNICKMAQE